MKSPILTIENLTVRFPVGGGLWRSGGKTLTAVDGVSLSVGKQESVGVVGESGCGKSTLANAILGLVEIAEGVISLEGKPVSNNRGRDRTFRETVQMVFQDPFGSLNPRMTIREILEEPARILAPERCGEELTSKIAGLVNSVGLEANCLDRYPHEFSGGQRQRIGIARALIMEPKLILCDEPVSALDVSIQAQIVNLLADLQKTHGLSYLFIAHDIAVVEHISDRIVVMYLGRVVEQGDAASVVRGPKHPYTKGLIASVPDMEESKSNSSSKMKGDLPSPMDVPQGCAFHTRCPYVQDRCRIEKPTLRSDDSKHWVACHRDIED